MNVGSSSQRQSSSGSTFVDPSQSQFFDFLRQAGMGLAQGQMGAGGQAQAAGELSAQLGGFGQSFLSNLQNIAGGAGQLPGSNFLEQRLSQQNPFLNEQITQLGQDIGQQFQQSILPGIRGNALSVGGLGGGRQGVAEGLAAQGATDAFARGSANLRFQDVGLRQAAASQLQNAGLGQQQMQIGAAQSGIGSLGGMMNLGMSPFAAAFSPLAQFAAILGPQNILSRQSGSGSGGSFNFGLS